MRYYGTCDMAVGVRYSQLGSRTAAVVVRDGSAACWLVAAAVLAGARRGPASSFHLNPLLGTVKALHLPRTQNRKLRTDTTLIRDGPAIAA